jgi:hypothetical protein
MRTTVIGGSIYWRDRFCYVGPDGSWRMSRQGHFDNFRFGEPGPEAAVAGVCCADEEAALHLPQSHPSKKTIRLCPVDDDRLLIIQASGDVFLMTGNPADGGKIELLLRG